MSAPTLLPLLARLDARDRALMARLVLGAASSRVHCRFWLMLTHLGGARFTIGVTLAFLAFPPTHRLWFPRAAASLLLSHVLVRLIKTRAERARPAVSMVLDTLVHTPDQFSFPSGHASAAMSVATAYAFCFPTFAPLSLLLAFLVGISRIALGVHYPGDVIAGQVLAVIVSIVAFA